LAGNEVSKPPVENSVVCVDDLETQTNAKRWRPGSQRNRVPDFPSVARARAVDETVSKVSRCRNAGIVGGAEETALSALATLSNPLDLASMSSDHFRQVVSLADQKNVADIFLLNYGDPVVGATEVTQHLATHCKGTVAVTFFGGGEEEKSSRVRIQELGIPVFPAPEGHPMASQLRSGLDASASLKRNTSEALSPASWDSYGKRNQQFLTEIEAIKYLKQYNIPYPKSGLARTAKDAVTIAKRIGYPVVLKIVSPHVVHKSDVGGVLMDLNNGKEVSRGFDEIKNHLAKVLRRLR
jgi:acetyltransferase